MITLTGEAGALRSSYGEGTTDVGGGWAALCAGAGSLRVWRQPPTARRRPRIRRDRPRAPASVETRACLACGRAPGSCAVPLGEYIGPWWRVLPDVHSRPTHRLRRLHSSSNENMTTSSSSHLPLVLVVGATGHMGRHIVKGLAYSRKFVRPEDPDRFSRRSLTADFLHSV